MPTETDAVPTVTTWLDLRASMRTAAVVRVILPPYDGAPPHDFGLCVVDDLRWSVDLDVPRLVRCDATLRRVYTAADCPPPVRYPDGTLEDAPAQRVSLSGTVILPAADA